ncbi:MAG: response regulator transcription factor [Actinomycetota bacterium]|nr:response regulator transcription factor [Actinomycetota bacterium]
MALVSVLGPAGYEVLEADTGEQALCLARELRPTLIVADILMPTMDGYELVRELRGDETTAHIPVVFYTATCAIDEVRRLASACGVSHILIKPCEPEHILAVIEGAVSRGPEPDTPLPSDEFHRQHLRLVNASLLEKVEELRDAVILAGSLQRESHHEDGFVPWPAQASRNEVEALLSRRELEVLVMIVDGATNSEIAARLVIATSTVQSHVKRILQKLGAKNRTEAAVRYVRR